MASLLPVDHNVVSEQPTASVTLPAIQTLVVEHLSKSYGSKNVVSDVSLTLKQGEVIGLLGPNGAGKTTCFYMIAGLVRADTGKVSIINGNQQEVDLTHSPIHQRARMGIGYLPQEASIFRKLSVEDNILAILQLRKDLNKKQRLEKLDALLDEVHLQHIRKSKGMSVSGGERRRVEVARALAMEPQFVLLDEPFAGVDPVSIRDIQIIIEHLQQRNIGVLITDHNVRETLSLCDKSYIIGSGVIIAEGDSQTILNNQKVRDTYLGENFKL